MEKFLDATGFTLLETYTFDQDVVRLSGESSDNNLDRFKVPGISLVACTGDPSGALAHYFASDGNEVASGPLVNGKPFAEVSTETDKTGRVVRWNFDPLPDETTRCINLYYRVLFILNRTPSDVWWW